MKKETQLEILDVVVCFCEGMTVRGLLIAIQKLNLTNRFLIIGSDGWADRQDVVIDYENNAVGSISIRIHSPKVKSFDDYYFGLDPFENKRNPWFKEFWEEKFHCKIPPERTKLTTTTMAASIDQQSTLKTDIVDEIDFATTTPSTTKQTPFCTGREKLVC